MPEKEKRVALVADLDDLLGAFDAQISSFETSARYAAIEYAEHNKPEARQDYQRASRSAELAKSLRGEVARRIRVLLPGEVDRLQNKG